MLFPNCNSFVVFLDDVRFAFKFSAFHKLHTFSFLPVDLFPVESTGLEQNDRSNTHTHINVKRSKLPLVGGFNPSEKY